MRSSRPALPYEPPSGFRASLRSGRPLFGLLCLSGSPQLVEMSGFFDLDFVILDMEHADGVGPAEILHLVRAADAARMPSLVRVPANRPELVQAVLDYGAAGVCVPHVRTPAEVEQVVRAVRYPPEGDRSTCPYIRASAYGGRADVASYTESANGETVVMVLVEEAEGIERLAEIVAVPGLDAVGVGLSDLARQLGLPGDASHPDLDAARVRAARLARDHGLAAWTTLSTSVLQPAEARLGELEARLAEGFSCFSWQDASIFREALLALKAPAYSKAFSPSR